jgi:hypothetical protein
MISSVKQPKFDVLAIAFGLFCISAAIMVLLK